MIGENVFLSFEEKQKRTPKNNGYWTGERGNSTFYSDNSKVKKLGCDCISYINGEPDFTTCSKFIFPIPSMTDDRLPYSKHFRSNYEQAYLKLSEELNMSENDAKKWLKNNHYTIHESNDLSTIYIVPTEIHKTYIHAGGVAECKSAMEDEEDDDLIEIVVHYLPGKSGFSG